MARRSIADTEEPLIVEAGIVMALVALVYFFSVSRQPLFGDGLELLCAAAVGGIPHPTGYPLLMLLLGPFSASYFSGSLLCALFGVAAAGFASLMVGRLLTPSLESFPQKFRSVTRIALGLAVGLSHSLWTAATVIEVYALNVAIMFAALTILSSRPAAPVSGRELGLAAFAIGLGLGNHLTILSVAPLLGMRLVESLRAKRTAFRSLPVIFAVAAIPAVALYATLPLRAAAKPPINWGNPTDIDGILWHLRGGDYASYAFLRSEPGVDFTLTTYLDFFAEGLLDLTKALGAQFIGGSAPGDPVIFSVLLGLVCFGVCGLGLKKLFCENKYLFIGQSVGMAFLVFVIFTYNISDIEDYHLAFFALLLPIMLIGIGAVLERLIAERGYREPEKQFHIVVVACVVVALAFLTNRSDAMRSGDLSSRPLTRTMAASLPPNAILMTHSDYDTGGFWYERYIEGLGEDVYHVSMHFMIYDWFAAMQPEKGEDPFGRHVDPSPGRYDQRTAEDQFSMIVENIIEPNIDSVPIYTTDIDPFMIQFLSRRYALVLKAELIDDQETYDDYVRRYPSYIPTRLYQIMRAI